MDLLARAKIRFLEHILARTSAIPAFLGAQVMLGSEGSASANEIYSECNQSEDYQIR